MLTFLSSYAEQREENEREKMELTREAKGERKSFFDGLLQIMSKRKWDVSSQESIIKVFVVKCVTFLANRFYTKLNRYFKSLKPLKFLEILRVPVRVV